MNKITLIIIVFSLFACNSQNATNKKSPLLEYEINQLLNNWHYDAATSNHEQYIGTMSSDAVYIGTDATEYWTQPDFAKWSKPYFDKKKTWNFKLVKRNIYFSSNNTVAWFDELLETGLGLCRGSGVLELTDNTWKIKQYVLSPTIPNNMIGEIVKSKKEADSLIVVKFRQK
ncbi:MAG: nuclear transport factor 2 family protein [Bacteroidota bacterium]